MVLKRIWLRASKMCDAAYMIMKIAVIISTASLAAAAICWLLSGGLTVNSYYTYYMAKEFTNLPFAILLLGVIISVCFEDRFQGKSL